MDGIDAALVRTDGENIVERGSMGFYPYSADVQQTLKAALEEAKHLMHRDDRTDQLKDVEALITQLQRLQRLLALMWSTICALRIWSWVGRAHL